MINEKTFAGFDNVISWVIVDPDNITDEHPEGVPYDFISAGVNKMELVINNQTLSSEDGYITYGNDGKVDLKLGSAKGVEAGIEHNVTLIVYDPSHVNGQIIVNDAYPLSQSTIELISIR